MLEPLRHIVERFSRAAYDPVAVIFELLLIGLSVAWCASILRGTRGTRLLKGLLIILVVVTLVVRVLSVQMGWTRLELLYRYFLIGLAFIALVAFQPELRRAFIRAGDVRFLRRGTPQSRVIAALVEAAGALSRNRHGALIAIQRGVGLRNWAEGGTMLNADVSADLLKSIFYPNSPLHDLGVIIQGDKILAASCQFPVAESGEIDPALGSRHRAAVGLSEETDALVLVVSEETGTISLADQGRLTRFLSLDELEEELRVRLGGSVKEVRTFSLAQVRRDIPRLLRQLAIVAPITLIIWYLADQASQITIEGVKVELDIVHDATLHVDVQQPQPPVFTVTFRGSTRAVENLASETAGRPLRVQWPLSEAYRQRPESRDPEPYHMDARVLLEGLGAIAARGLSVQKVSPPTLTFVVSEVATVTMPVRVAAGALNVTDVQIQPPQVRVSMRRGELERLTEEQRVVTAPVEERLAGAGPDQVRTLGVVPLDTRIGGFTALRVQPPAVDISLRVVGQRTTRRLAPIAVQLLTSPVFWEHYALERRDPNEWLIEIEVAGDRNVVEALKPQDVRAYVRMAGEEPLSSMEFRPLEVVVELPPGVTLVGAAPTVHARLTAREGPVP